MGNAGKITNKDIARLAGVSPAAVSIAVNGKAGISDETRNHILEIARRHHYAPGGAPARALSARGGYIAVLFRTDASLEDQAFYSEMSANIMVACCERGCTMVSTYITGEGGVIVLPEAIRTGGVAGVLVFGDQEPGLYTELRRAGVPFVVLDSSRRTGTEPAVTVDYAAAAYRATRHLLELGHRDIAYLSNGTLHDFNTLTLSGFQRAAAEAGIALYPNRFQIDLGDDESLRRCVDRALAGPERPTAILCTVDMYAIHMIRYLRSRGLRVPEDVSVVGIDDILMSSLVSPSLTTMHVDRKAMARVGLEMLEELIAGGACENRTLATPELVRRESTAALNR